METFCNAQTFADNYINNEKLPKKLKRLLLFTFYSKFSRNVDSRLPYSNIVATNTTNGDKYIFKYNGKEYPFSVFSDNKLDKYDKKILKSVKRIEESKLRCLKLACSLDLVNPRIVIGNSLNGLFSIIIAFQENKKEKVIDYENNLIMSRDDYYEIFNFRELNTVDKMDLYNIYYLMNKTDDYEHLYEYLIFTKEIFNELSKKEDFSFLTEKYDSNGYNKHNYLIFGNDCECLFFQKQDVDHRKYKKLIREINDFTENPTKKTKHITYVKDKGEYILKARNFGYFTFDLLSNSISEEEVKEILLSDRRYHKCHINANRIARSLSSIDKTSIYVVGGKFKINETDYWYHSWIEIDDKNLVIDFNTNIIMNRDKYYELYGVIAISKTSVLEMEDIVQTVIYDTDLVLHPMEINYFGTEIMRDLKKNEKILKK